MRRSAIRWAACILVLGLLSPAWAESPESDATSNETMKLGLDGYSPVALVRGGRAVSGSPELRYVHHGVTYFMADAAELELFEKDPDAYQGGRAGGDVHFARRYQDKTYIFASEKAAAEFDRGDKDAMIAMARKNYEHLVRGGRAG